MPLYGLIVAIAVTALILLIYSLIQTGSHTSFIKKRIARVIGAVDKNSLEEATLSPLTDILSAKLEKVVNRFVPVNIVKEIAKRIETAKIKDFDVAKYFLLKIIIGLFILIFIPLYFSILKIKMNFGVIAILLIVGFIFPDLVVKSKIAKRHKEIIKDLPYFIDLLRVCVEAGMDLEGALCKIVDNSVGLLREETAQAVAEIKMGKGISEALHDMSERINYADFSSFITVVLQSNQMGISISNVLKTQSLQINLKYLQSMRSRAAKIPIMILIPMVFFILPALLVVVIGPAIIQVISVF